MNTIPRPPRLARALLRLAAPEEERDIIDGDLHELYVERRIASGGVTAATWYWLEVLSCGIRFMVHRIARTIRGLAGGNATPSALDFKLGARILAKSPGLSLVGGFGIAVAVALGAASYAVINSYFYPKVPLSEGDRIVAISKFDPRQRMQYDERLLHDFLIWRRELRLVGDLGAFRTIRRNLVPETGQGEPITLAEMTAAGFRVARVAPLIGRTLLDADELPGAAPVVVIGYDVWQSRFTGDRGVVGRTIRIGRIAHTIVGVMPKGFAFPISHQFWVPLHVDPRAPIVPGAGPTLDVFGRLAAGATKESAQAELNAVSRRIAAEVPAEFAQEQSRILPYTDVFLKGEAQSTSETNAVMRLLIALFLVVVAMNVAVLVYARTVMRTGEIAVRTALGATRARIVTQLFAEAFVLSGLSSVVGLVVVAVGLRMLDSSLNDIFEGQVPFWLHSGLSLGTMLYTLALAVLAAVIIGVFPALRATGAQLRAAMGSLGSGAKARLGLTWTVLIVAQVAITVAVLPLALRKGAEMIQFALRRPGFSSGQYLAAQFTVERDADASALSNATSASGDSNRVILNALLARLATERGVVGVTITTNAPWEGRSTLVEVDGANTGGHRAGVMMVDTSYFHMFGVRMLAGRGFGMGDGPMSSSSRPVIVNRSFVSEILGGGAAVGRRIRYPSFANDAQPWITIVGVVEDFPSAIKQPGGTTTRSAAIYHLALPGEMDNALLTVRLRGQTPEEFAPTLRRLATSVDPMLQLSSIKPLDVMYGDYAKSGAQLALLVAVLAGTVVLLSAAGIHALMSFAVNQRRREIGIRSALGAPARRILTSVLARATRQLALGVGFGLTAAVVIDQLNGGAMMNGTGLFLVPGTAAFMLVVGLLAAAGPARRGLRVQPTEALRAE